MSALLRPRLGVSAAVAAVAAVALAVAGCSQPTGVRIDVELGDFQSTVRTLDIVVSAVPGGFDPIDLVAGGATLRTEDIDGDGAPDLVVRFPDGYTFGRSLSFRVATGNRRELTVRADAQGFDAAGTQIATATSASVALPPDGDATLALKLATPMGPVNPGMMVDVPFTPAITVNGPHALANLSAVAVCDVDGDGTQDLVFGVPGAMPSVAMGATGAVYVVFGGGPNATVDLASPPGGTITFHVFGVAAGDQLGAAIACADLDNGGAADLIIGAPGVQGATPADAALGAVYVIAGGMALRNTVYDLTRTPGTAGGPTVVWVGGAAQAKLGSALHAADLDGDNSAEVLASAPGEAGGRVHVLTRVGQTGGWLGRQVLGATAAAHVTITGVPAAALAAGDFEGDGMPVLDVVVGDPGYTKAGETDARGIAYVFPSVSPVGAQALDPSAARLVVEGELRARLGAAVLALDTRGRGDDLLVGAPGARGAAGEVTIFRNDMAIFGILTRTPNTTLAGAAANDRFGSALAGAVSGGVSRLFVGAPLATREGRTGAGAVHVFRSTLGDPAPHEVIFGAAADDHLGSALAAANIGMGALVDVVMAAPDATGSGDGSGVAYVRFGQ